MTAHDLLVLLVALVCAATNILGALFTTRRNAELNLGRPTQRSLYDRLISGADRISSSLGLAWLDVGMARTIGFSDPDRRTPPYVTIFILTLGVALAIYGIENLALYLTHR